MTRRELALWSRVPWSLLPRSAKVDITLLLVGFKPAVRFIPGMVEPVLGKFTQIFLDYSVGSHEGCVYIANNQLEINKLISADSSFKPHEKEFGSFLGYPSCCCNFIANIGESFIDEYERFYNGKSPKNTLLDISNYLKGIALISHIPCSEECEPSLQIAGSFLNNIKKTQGKGLFKKWQSSLLDYFQ